MLFMFLICRVFEPENSDQVALGLGPVGTSSRWLSLVATWSRCGAHSQASLNGTESLFLKTL